jgi:hypothetical protein
MIKYLSSWPPLRAWRRERGEVEKGLIRNTYFYVYNKLGPDNKDHLKRQAQDV